MTREELLKIAKPILFNTEMVRAIVYGSKIATRRCVKFKGDKNPNWTGYILDGLNLYNGNNEICNKKLPYKTGDILYVREAWAYPKAYGERQYLYKASIGVYPGLKWHPSIHMPKEVARIFLRVKNVRLEHLQDITVQGILEEGIIVEVSDLKEYKDEAMKLYANLWNSTIPKSHLETYGWDANPWIGVIEFERVEVDA